MSIRVQGQKWAENMGNSPYSPHAIWSFHCISVPNRLQIWSKGPWSDFHLFSHIRNHLPHVASSMEITPGAFRPDLEPIWCRNTVKTPYCMGAIWGISPVFGPFSTLHSNAHNFANTQYFSAILPEIERAHSQLSFGGFSSLRDPLSVQLRLVKHAANRHF